MTTEQTIDPTTESVVVDYWIWTMTGVCDTHIVTVSQGPGITVA